MGQSLFQKKLIFFRKSILVNYRYQHSFLQLLWWETEGNCLTDLAYQNSDLGQIWITVFNVLVQNEGAILCTQGTKHESNFL